jgi:putative SOS response-associated peptidase YedK
MCGRVTLTRRGLDEVAAELGAELDAANAARYRARYNVAPTDLHWVLIADDAGQRRIVPAIWGVPAKTRPIINVRAESVRKGAFKSRKHALAITDGYYEWLREKKVRRPFWYHDPARRLVLLAALDTPLVGSALAATAFTIITVPANALAAAVHDRMPAVIAPERADTWLRSPAPELLAPAAEDALAAVEVSTRVNRVANDDPACLAPPPAGLAPGGPEPRPAGDGDR